MNKMKLFTVLALLFNTAFAFAAEPVECESRIHGFNIYEYLEKGRIKEDHTVIENIQEWSPHTTFEGLLVKATDEAQNLEIEIFLEKKGKIAGSVKKTSFPLRTWKKDSTYKATDGLDSKAFFDDISPEHVFVLRLIKDGKVLCADSAREIQGGD